MLVCYTFRMLTAQTLLDTLASQKDALQKFGVTRMGVFGSTIRGESTEKSDIDLLVEFEPSSHTYRNYYGTATYLENLFKRPVDLVTSNSISPYIKPYIEKEIQYVQIAN